jgi:hypothetical protein
LEQWHRPSQIQRRPRVYQKKVQEETVNDRIQTFFGRQTSIMIVRQPVS